MDQVPMIDPASREDDVAGQSRPARDPDRRRLFVILGWLAAAMIVLCIVLWLVVSNLLEVIYSGAL
ncbi:hypothetical protein [Corynebacterium pilosum]|uniref:Uncharacterized protein n=1 Tax=Corynebacterium pilosum TaxID=35756 RepID=A0A376CKH5_9CORY|nr:hypothetical protein [Corynebacterium pilosum]STC69001.1 Uncharacterised protein [Corynebacterium pilosum]